jgi:biopolymer transport protein ExbB
MIEFIVQGGKTMLPLFICSLISVTIIIERFFALRSARILPVSLTRVIESSSDVPALVHHARGIQSALSRVILGIFEKKSAPADVRHTIFSTLYKKEINALERGLTALEVIAAITPLLGLLGTVLGMVDVFNVVAEVGVGQASALSSGISKALITTIAGLIIAIPTLVFHSFFIRKSETIALSLEEYSQAFYHLL